MSIFKKLTGKKEDNYPLLYRACASYAREIDKLNGLIEEQQRVEDEIKTSTGRVDVRMLIERRIPLKQEIDDQHEQCRRERKVATEQVRRQRQPQRREILSGLAQNAKSFLDSFQKFQAFNTELEFNEIETAYSPYLSAILPGGIDEYQLIHSLAQWIEEFDKHKFEDGTASVRDTRQSESREPVMAQ